MNFMINTKLTDAAPDDLHTQVPLINSVLAAANIPQIGIDGWEADDDSQFNQIGF